MGGGPRFNPLAITSMVLGIIAIPSCCCIPIGSPMAIASLVLGIISLGKIKQSPQAFKGGGMAIAGIVCSGVALILDLLALLTTIDDNFKSTYGGGHF